MVHLEVTAFLVHEYDSETFLMINENNSYMFRVKVDYQVLLDYQVSLSN